MQYKKIKSFVQERQEQQRRAKFRGQKNIILMYSLPELDNKTFELFLWCFQMKTYQSVHLRPTPVQPGQQKINTCSL